MNIEDRQAMEECSEYWGGIPPEKLDTEYFETLAKKASAKYQQNLANGRIAHGFLVADFAPELVREAEEQTTRANKGMSNYGNVGQCPPIDQPDPSWLSSPYYQ